MAKYLNSEGLAELVEKVVNPPQATQIDSILVKENGKLRQADYGEVVNPQIIEDCLSYGVKKDIADSSTVWTRTGSMNLHRSLPIQESMKGVLIDGETGEEVQDLTPESWENDVTDGSMGQVVVKVPGHYKKCWMDGTVMNVRISQYALPGYTYVPTFYYGAYKATVEHSTNKLCSVANTDEDYRGGNNNANWDGTYRSLLGLPSSAISLTNYQIYARNRGEAGRNGAGWNCKVYSCHEALCWLYVIEYANSNVQATYNAELTAEGFRQGGLGNGCTTLNYTYWGNYNSYYPFIPCGYNNDIGNGTGIKAFTMPEEYNNGVETVIYSTRYRGIDDIFGHLNEWTIGVLTVVNPASDEYPNGQAQVFVCDDPAKFSVTDYSEYDYVGDQCLTDGTYIKEIIFGSRGCIVPSVGGGTSTTYFPDYNYIYTAGSNPEIRGLNFGGYGHNGAGAGLFYCHSRLVPTYTGAYQSSRLCFLPEDPNIKEAA